MVKYIYFIFGGFDYERLLYYFIFFENCGCVDFGKYVIKLEIYIRLLKKFKVVVLGKMIVFLFEFIV